MRIIVMSDSHGNYRPVDNVINKHFSDSDLFIHLGDGKEEFDKAVKFYPDKKFLFVSGNCDWDFSPPTKFLIEDGIKIMYTHGHDYQVKTSLDKLIKSAEQHSARILLYGHTHKNFTKYTREIYIMNPGSIGQSRYENSSYGIVDITKNGIAMFISEV